MSRRRDSAPRPSAWTGTGTWDSDPALAALAVASIEMPPVGGLVEDFPAAVPASVAEGLRSLGIRGVYTHQKESCALALDGKDVVVATPASSGKSLAYILPLLAKLHSRPQARALLLFPTKALGRDQEKSLAAFIRSAGLDAPVVTYDGDTPRGQRGRARGEASVLITNPDMLHASLLPRHPAWSGFFSALELIVIDEIHQYRGIFGSHVANVLRRLRRVLGFYGAAPAWISLSATIGNPLELTAALTGRPTILVDRGSAPSPGRTLKVFSTPLLDPATGVRGNYLKLAARIAALLVRGGA